MENVNLLSPSVLAFVGDAVYGLYVRTHLASVNRPSGELHKASVQYVSAGAQARAFSVIEPYLDSGEMEIFKRGRNFHTGTAPKNATSQEYHIATGLETLFGFLYLSGRHSRAEELFRIIWEKFSSV